MTRLRLAWFLSASVVAVTTVSTVARADAVPPAAYACDSNAAPGHFDASKLGTSCQVGSSGATGTCQKDTCTGIDYGAWDRDASATPPSKSFDCLSCVAGDAGTSSGGSSSGTSSDSGCKASGAPAGGAGPWLLAALVPLAILGARGRRRSRRSAG